MGEQKRYALSDADMLGIFEAIDSAENAGDVVVIGIKATWNAILAQEGKSWDDFTTPGSIDPRAFAIPRDQSSDVLERMRNRALDLGVSAIAVTGMLLDYMNWGPSHYN